MKDIYTDDKNRNELIKWIIKFIKIINQVNNVKGYI